MTERPILFSAPMVRALLAGTKTQTRRIIKPQPDEDGLVMERGNALEWFDTSERSYRCPYGQPGDRLWVRETARCIGQGTDFVNGKIRLDVDYKAGGGTSVHFALDEAPRWFPARSQKTDGTSRWQPAIHMPRWASRILLEVTEVRVQRLQEISEADAQAEGISPHRKGGWWWEQPPDGIAGTNHFGAKTARDAYGALWESINGPGSWDANPWVWVVEFKRLP